MFKLCVFAAVLAVALADPKPKPGVLAAAPLVAAPVHYPADYSPLTYSTYHGHYSMRLLNAAYSAPLAFDHAAPLVYSSPYVSYV